MTSHIVMLNDHAHINDGSVKAAIAGIRATETD
jgi:hypothetical protein